MIDFAAFSFGGTIHSRNRLTFVRAVAIVAALATSSLLGACSDKPQTASAVGGAGAGGGTNAGGEAGANTGGTGPDVCLHNNCHPEATCSPNDAPEPGDDPYLCACNDGWDGNGKVCADIDECALDMYDCNESRVCENISGGYDCVCPIGSQGPDDNSECIRRYSALSLAYESSCAVAEDDTMWCWGRGTSGANGNGSGANQANIVQVGESNRWTATVRMGEQFGCGIKDYGAMWCWGRNGDGQLGIGSKSSQLLPAVADIDLDWKAVAAGEDHTCGIQVDGTLWCWGRNTNGQLGTGTMGSTDELSPVQVGTGTDWAAIDTGYLSSCGLKTDGTLWCWGNNSSGELGIGSSTGSYPDPTPVGMDADWAQVRTGRTTCGIKTNGALFCWGRNTYGQVGDDTTAEKTVPTPIAEGTVWKRVRGGFEHNCAIKDDDTLWCWGANYTGQLAQTDTDRRLVPVQIGGDSDWTDVSGGLRHTCGLKKDGSLACWGGNDWGQLGRGSFANPQTPNETAQAWAQFSGHLFHSCGVENDSTLWCAGAGGYGRLGLGDAVARQVHTQVGSAADWASVATSELHTCAVKNDKTLWCWGYGSERALGFTNGTSYDTPQAVGTDTDWSQVAGGRRHSCAIKADKTLWCWGDNNQGESASGGTSNYVAGTSQVGTDNDWESVRAFYQHSCALKTDTTLWCWGAGSYGRLGNGAANNQPTPTPVTNGSAVSDYSVGYYHSCAVKTDGTLWCWGRNNQKQLGQTPNTNVLAPLQVGSASDWATVSVSAYHSCARKTDDTLWCWGDSSWGQLGLGPNLGDKSSPTQVGQDGDWTWQLSFGDGSIGARTNGKTYVWGRNTFGKLGDGEAWLMPGPVLGPENTP